MEMFRQQVRDAAGRESLDDIAKDHVSHSDRHAEDSG